MTPIAVTSLWQAIAVTSARRATSVATAAKPPSNRPSPSTIGVAAGSSPASAQALRNPRRARPSP